jgi:Domain of Unknown Function (DUF1080)
MTRVNGLPHSSAVAKLGDFAERWLSFLGLAGLVLFAAIGSQAQNGQVQSEGWQSLWDGKSLNGWEHVGPGGFSIQEGLLKTEGGMGLLWYTKQKFSSGDSIRVVFKTTSEHSNSGVYIRFPEPPKDPWYPVHNGYEVQIDGAGDDWHCTGSIYSLSKAIERTQKPPGEWNTMDVEFKDAETIVHLNGKLVNDFHGNTADVPKRVKWFEPVRGPRANTGYIGLQNHDGSSTVFFKEVLYRPGH